MHFKSHTVGEVMLRDLIVILPEQSLSDALWIMTASNSQWLAVCSRDQTLIGVISWLDFLFHFPSLTLGISFSDRPSVIPNIQVKDVMTPKAISLQPHHSLKTALDIMVNRHTISNTSARSKVFISNIPIIDEHNQFLGVIGYTDLLKDIDSNNTSVENVLSHPRVPTVTTSHTIKEANYLLHEYNQRYVLVVNERDLPIGMLSDTQVYRYMKMSETGFTISILQAMTDLRHYRFLQPDDAIEKAILILSNPSLGLRALPVMKDKKLYNVISYIDILKFFQ